MPNPDPIGFVAALLDRYRENDCTDIDGGDLHELLLKHGITYETTATADDIKQEWALDYDIGLGDPCTKISPEWIAIRDTSAAIRAENERREKAGIDAAGTPWKE